MTTKWSTEMHGKCKNNDYGNPAVPTDMFYVTHTAYCVRQLQCGK